MYEIHLLNGSLLNCCIIHEHMHALLLVVCMMCDYVLCTSNRTLFKSADGFVSVHTRSVHCHDRNTLTKSAYAVHVMHACDTYIRTALAPVAWFEFYQMKYEKQRILHTNVNG